MPEKPNRLSRFRDELKRRKALPILLVICILTISCSSNKDLSTRPLYSIDKYDYHDAIQGTLYKSQLLIAKEIDSVQSSVVTLEKYVHRAQAMYSMDLLYTGQVWRHIDEIVMTIDGEVITLSDEHPVRIRKSGEAVTESLTCFLDEPAFKSLRYCKSMTLQFSDISIIIPREGCEAVWNFLKE